MALNKLGIFHPRFYYQPRPSVNSAMVSRVEVWRPTGEPSRWEPDGDDVGTGYTLLWRSQARLQRNKDWRARPKAVAGEYEATHAMRVQLPIGKNELGAIRAGYPGRDKFPGPSNFPGLGGFSVYGPDMSFYKDDMVRVIASPVLGAEEMVGDEYFVRNSVNSGNRWLHNLLCDGGTKAQDHG